MAIMGIPQALKLIEGPIDALARLPQQSLVAMAQRSPSLLKVLPIVLNEKADEAQRVANMAALAQGTPPSVTEQNMAINAQAEAQPMMLPENVGVAALPVPEGSYAGGGIVAFDDGGEVPRYQNQGLIDLVRAQQGGDPYSQYSFVQTRPQTYEDYLQMTTAARAAVPPSPEAAAIRKYLDDTKRKASDVRTDAYLRAVEAGLGIMGGTSPYAFTNIGQGSQAAIKGFAEDVKERRKQSLADMQLKLQLDQAERNEKLAAITAAENAFGRQQDITSREEIARRDIASREEMGQLDRDIRKYVADNPQDLVIAKAIKKPKESLEEAITRLINLKKTDEKTYNATAALFGRAMSDTTEALKAAESPGGILYRIRTNFDWVKATYPEVKTPAQALELYEKERKDIITRGIRDFRDTTGIDPSQLGRASGFGVRSSETTSPSLGAINALRADPSKAAEFDRKFGPGEAAKVLFGQ